MFSNIRCIVVLTAVFIAITPSGFAADIRDVVGVAHIDGRYSFPIGSWPVTDGTKRDYLNEGADEVARLGTNVIKVWLHPNAVSWYHYTANPSFPTSWYYTTPENRLVSIASSPQFSALFQRPFKTFVLNIMSNVPIYTNGSEDVTKFGFYDSVLDGLTASERNTEQQAMYNLAIYLLDTYRGSGKTFVFQNHEGDHILRLDLSCHCQDLPSAPPERVQPMIDWTNARQDGVTTARNARPGAGVTVVNAAEVNDVWDSSNNMSWISMVNSVIPYTHCDLYSYSAWDSRPDVEGRFAHDLDYLATQAPDSALYGDRDIYIGEYGQAENTQGGAQAQLDTIRRMTEIALGWGVRYTLYWNLYCNEPTDPAITSPDIRPTNSQMAGLWLIRPDGTHAPVYDYFVGLFQKSVHRVTFRAYYPYYVSADEFQAERVVADRTEARQWEHFAVIDLNGGVLNPGDQVNIISHTGHYVCAELNGGDVVNANRTQGGPWETFTILKQNGSGGIVTNDAIALQTGGGYYFVAEGGGGPGSVVNANRLVIGVWETFTYSEE